MNVEGSIFEDEDSHNSSLAMLIEWEEPKERMMIEDERGMMIGLVNFGREKVRDDQHFVSRFSLSIA
jgi:hypothetical protein